MENSSNVFPPESILQFNLRTHREKIIQYLAPSHRTLYGFLSKFNLDEDIVLHHNRRQIATIILERVEKEKNCEEFLKCLEKDDEHLGHTHIASLLRGNSSSDTKTCEESESICTKINEECLFVILNLSIPTLLPHLRSNKLVTDSDVQELSLNSRTDEEKVKLFLTFLKTKGPIAHYIFFHECLANENEHLGHQCLYKDLMQLPASSKSVRKRKAPTTSEPPKKVPRCLYLIQLRGGIVASDYLSKIRDLRQLSDPDYAQRRIQVEIDYPKNSPESRIAYCLEMCYYFAADLNKTKKYVRESRKMLKKFEDSDSESLFNAEILEARCRLVLGRCMSICQKSTQAEKEIDSALAILSTFEKGEDCILANYFKACSLMKEKSPRKWSRIVTHLQISIDISEQQNYGMDIAQFCKIRLAQAYLHLTADNPISEMPVQSNDIKRAQDLLKDVEIKHQDMKPAAKCFHLMTYSDVTRMAGDIAGATAFAEQAERMPETVTPYHTSLIEKRLSLLKL